MHIILVLMMLSHSTDVIDAFVLTGIKDDQSKFETYCSINGAFTLITEMSAYFYLFSYSYVMKKKITSLTASIRKIKIMAHVLSILLPFMIYMIVILAKDGFGLSVSASLIKFVYRYC
jgi:hypothetical protein